jgi:iron complex transport system substrate-binding protein
MYMEVIKVITIMSLVVLLLFSAVANAEGDERDMDNLCEFPFVGMDAGGAVVNIVDEPRKIVTLAPSAAQTIWEIGGSEKVVGLTHYAGYLEGASDREIISNMEGGIILEKVVLLEPDLIIAPSIIPEKTVKKLRESGMIVYHSSEMKTIEDIIEETRLIGKLSGECEGAEITVDWMEMNLKNIAERTIEKNNPTAIYVFYGWTAGDGTLIHEVIRKAGGKNSAGMMGISGYRQINAELLVQESPEWIILNSDEPDAAKNNEVLSLTRAAKENRVIVVPVEYISQPAPRIIIAIDELSNSFHPEGVGDESESILLEEEVDKIYAGLNDKDQNIKFMILSVLLILIIALVRR